MTYSSIIIRKKANKVWFITDNTTPPGNNGNSESKFEGGSRNGYVTIKSLSGQIVYNNQPYTVFQYIDELDSGNNLTNPSSDIELCTHLTAQGFFTESSGGGGDVPTIQGLLNSLISSLSGRGGQYFKVDASELGFTTGNPSFDGQNNISLRKTYFVTTGSGVITNGEAVDYLNDNATITVSPENAPKLIRMIRTENGISKAYIFDFKPGQGTYGSGGTLITFNDLFYKGEYTITQSDVDSWPNSSIKELGTVTVDAGILPDLVDNANSNELQPFDLTDAGVPDSDGNPKTYFFSFTYDGVLYFARFDGASGLYGNDGDNPFTEANFVITTNENEVPNIQYTSQLINDGDGTSPFATEQYVDDEINNLNLAETSYVNAAAVVRMNTTTGQWEFVEDAGHQTIFLSSIENLETPGYNFRINYPEVNNIGALIFSPDEGYAAVDLKAGGSVGLTSADIRVTRSGMAVSFSCNSGIWSMDDDDLAVVMPSDFTFSFNTSSGNLSVIHLPLIFNYGDKVIVQMNNNLYTVEYVSKANASFVVRFRDSSGNIVLTPNDDLDFTVYRTGTYRVPNANIQNIPSSGTNFWVQGIFAKTGISGNTPFDYPIDTYPVNGSDDLITSGGVYNYVQAEKQNFQEVTTEGSTTTNNVTFQGSVDLHNPSGTAGNGSILRFRSGGSATPEAMIVHELISGTQANLNFRVRTSSSSGDAGLTEIVSFDGGSTPTVNITGKATVSVPPTNSTDVARKTELDVKADLVGGKVPASQLPAFVDDVLEYANLAAFPVTGESDKIYIAIDTNKTYRWSGSAYVVVGNDLALGETLATAYRGDRGKVAYDHSQTTGNPHGTTIADISGLQGQLNDLNTDVNAALLSIEILNSYVSKTANYTLSSSDTVVDLVSNSATFTLPDTAIGAGKKFTVKNSGSGTTLTLATTGGKTIDGVSTKTFNTQYSGCTVVCDGTNWKIIGLF